MQHTTAADPEGVAAQFFHFQRHVPFSFLEEPVTQMTAADEFAVFAEERRVIDAEDHRQSGFVDFDGVHLFRTFAVRNGVRNINAGDPHDPAQVAAFHLLGIGSPDPFKGEKLFHIRRHLGAVPLDEGEGLGQIQRTTVNSADPDTAHKVGVIQRGHLKQHRAVNDLRCRYEFQNSIQQGHNGFPGIVHFPDRPAITAAGVQHREVQLFIGGVQFAEEVKNLVQHFLHTGIRFVHLVNDHQRTQVQRKGFFQHETGLGHGAFGRVHQQDHAVSKFQNTLHLTAEVAVSGSVDNIDLHIFVNDADIFGKDGDPPFPFQVVVIQKAVFHFLIGPEKFGLFGDLVHQRGFAVVHMGDNSDISEFTHRKIS